MADTHPRRLSRRTFAAVGLGSAAAAPLIAQDTTEQNTAVPHRRGTEPEEPAFGETIEFTRQVAPGRV
jgi:hypothetical protein